MSLKLIAEQLLLGSPRSDSIQDLKSIQLYIPGELTMHRWVFTRVTTLYASPNNPGAERAAEALGEGLRQLNEQKLVDR